VVAIPTVFRRLAALTATVTATVLPTAEAAGQEIWIEGTVRCADPSLPGEYRFATHTLVSPRTRPSSAVLTNNAGYYSLALPRRDVIDRALTLWYIGRDSVEVARFFIGRERVSSHGGVRLRTVNSQVPCGYLEHDPLVAERRLDSVRVASGRRGRRWREAAGGVVAGALGAILASVSAAVETGPPPSDFVTLVGLDTVDAFGRWLRSRADSLRPTGAANPVGAFRAATLFSLTRTGLSENVGFSFSPSRDIGEAVLWNPAAITLAERRYGIARTDYRRFLYGAMVWPMSHRVALMAGYFMLHQEKDDLATDEQVAVIGGSTWLTQNAAVGLAVKYLRQKVAVWLEQPGLWQVSTFVQCDGRAIAPCGSAAAGDLAYLRPDSASGAGYDLDHLRNGGADLDAGVIWRALPSLQVGVTVANVLGTRFHDSDGTAVRLRAVGLGVNYLRGRLNLGTDVKVGEDGPIEVSVGANAALLDDLVLRAGLALVHPFPRYHLRMMRGPSEVSARGTLTPWVLGIRFRSLSYSFGYHAAWGAYHFGGLRLTF
jgi:hypothetical protein